MHNNAPPLVWPPLLKLPPADKLIVYLDFNHWIGLSQARVGHCQGAIHVDVLDACRAARSAGRALFVLSAAVYAELQNIGNPDKRRHLADVMEELTDFNSLVARHIVMRAELSAVLDRIARLPSPLSSVPLVGRGVRHAFGVQTGLSIMDLSGDATERLRGQYGAGAFDAYIQNATREMERSVMRGPVGLADEAYMRAIGYRPELPALVIERRAEQEREFKRILDSDSKSRRGRLYDKVSARELIIEFQNILPRGLEERGLILRDVMQDPESGRRFVQSMPSTDVATLLKATWHKNSHRGWKTNDVHDIDALALATPYCDVVVTEKACCHILSTAKVAERMNTALLRHLADLPAVLQNRTPKRL